MLPKTLTLVDDDLDYAGFLAAHLEERGVTVSRFADSSDLLAYAKRGAPQMLSIMNMVQALSLKPGN